ncbi:MAG TPA: hypothetical protein VEG42_05015 [Thermoplasmata archaeon]|nr:hypothetical protein [Thermoplasmata archaeon]
MQLISVERWTFWGGVAAAFFGPLITAVLEGLGWLSYTTPTDAEAGWLPIVFVLLLVSVALGGSRDPSVRRVPAQPEA